MCVVRTTVRYNITWTINLTKFGIFIFTLSDILDKDKEAYNGLKIMYGKEVQKTSICIEYVFYE